MPDVLKIKNCPKCGKTHRYELQVVRTPAPSQNSLGDAPRSETFRTRSFHCPTVNEQFQHRFPLLHEPNTEIIEVNVGEILDYVEPDASSYLTRVFVSYSRMNEAIVTPIVHIIRALGLRVFQDIDSIPYGKRWHPKPVKGSDEESGL